MIEKIRCSWICLANNKKGSYSMKYYTYKLVVNGRVVHG